MDDATKKELQAATFERLIQHLRERKDVQNIDLMNLAGFCRNCLSRWYREEAKKKGIEIHAFIILIILFMITATRMYNQWYLYTVVGVVIGFIKTLLMLSVNEF